jgi:hypothetical protein
VSGMRWRLPAHPVDVLGVATKPGFWRRNGGIGVISLQSTRPADAGLEVQVEWPGQFGHLL